MRKVIINHDTNRSINIDIGKFKGDVEAAIYDMEAYTKLHPGAYQSFGWGYGELTLGEETHSTNRYGIDVAMMVEWCHLNLADYGVVEEKETLSTGSYSSAFFSLSQKDPHQDEPTVKQENLQGPKSSKK